MQYGITRKSTDPVFQSFVIGLVYFCGSMCDFSKELQNMMEAKYQRNSF